MRGGEFERGKGRKGGSERQGENMGAGVRLMKLSVKNDYRWSPPAGGPFTATVPCKTG